MGPEAAKAFAEFLASQGLCFNRKGDIVPMESPKAGVIKPGDVPEKLRIKANNLLDENGNVVKWESQAMSGEQLIPNAVGRLDDVVEAIREGDRERASQLTLDEYCRLERNATKMESQARKIRDAANACLDFQNYVLTSESGWEQARRDCGWSGVDGFDPAKPGGDFTVETPVKPALRAEELPIGTVMVLGGMRRVYGENRGWGGSDNVPYQVAVMVFYGGGVQDREFTPAELQELIDRGVRFEIPEGGSNVR